MVNYPVWRAGLLKIITTVILPRNMPSITISIKHILAAPFNTKKYMYK